MKLFCVPYSGGSATVFLKWNKFLDNEIEIIPVELKGRGKRICEPLYQDVNEAAIDVADIICSQINDNEKYMIWGHSLGALIAYEAYYKIDQKILNIPVHMFFSGRMAPYNTERKTEYHKLPEKEFIEAVNNYGENTKAVLQNEELRELFVPILRNDFKLAEIYIPTLGRQKMKTNITIVNGRNDISIKDYDMSEWGVCTEANCEVITMEGNHFFLFNHNEDIKKLIDGKLQQYK